MPEPEQKPDNDQGSLLDNQKPAEPAPETKAVEKAKPKDSIVPTDKSGKTTTLAPVAKIQRDVISFATRMFDQKRASEFATRVALIARDNKQLKEAIEKNPDSFLSAYMASVSLNLMPNTPEGDAYIIPYGDKVQFQTGYKGLIKLARRSGEIKTINAELVFDGDDFDVELGSERRIVHKPNYLLDRTAYIKVTHAYATALLTNGEFVFEVLSRKELNKVQQAGATNGPWKSWPERMALKTALKRLCNLLPKDDVLAKALAMDSLGEVGKLKVDNQGNVIDGEVASLPKSVIDEIETAKDFSQLQAILNDLSPAEKKIAQPLIDKRLEEL